MSIVNKPHTFSPNTTVSSSEVNDNFDTLYNDYNGGISAANLATDSVTTAKIADSNVTTAKIADSNITSAKLAQSFFKGRYQANTTNSDQSGITVQFGWGFIAGSGTNSTSETVTFPTAFTTVLSINVTPLGVLSGSDPTAITDLTGEHGNDVALFAASDISTTTFRLGLNAEQGRNLAASTIRYGYSWIAFGIV